MEIIIIKILLLRYGIQKNELKRVIVSVSNDLYTDQRVNRTCLVLHEMGYDVLLVGRKRKTSLPLQDRPYKTSRLNLFFEKGFIFYALLNIRLFFFLLLRKVDLLFANDLDTLLPNFLISKLKKIPLVYDTHEFFLGVPEIQSKPLVKKVWHIIESYIFPKLKHVITVNNSIANLYKESYGLNLGVVRNVPIKLKIPLLKSRQELNMPIDKKIVLLQGAGINMDRGGEEAVLAMLPQFGMQNIVLYIIGDGDAVDYLKEISVKHNLIDRIIFLPKQSMMDLFHYTANADIGLSLDKDTNINYQYSLPNKIFDYINAGVPVLASKLIEIENVITTYQVGCLVETVEPAQIASSIKYMLADEKRRLQWKDNLVNASKELNWENEKIKLLHIIEKL